MLLILIIFVEVDDTIEIQVGCRDGKAIYRINRNLIAIARSYRNRSLIVDLIRSPDKVSCIRIGVARDIDYFFKIVCFTNRKVCVIIIAIFEINITRVLPL